MSTSRRIVKSILRCHRQWRRRRRRSYFMKERIYLFYSLTTFREATDQMKRFSANIGQLIFFLHCFTFLFLIFMSLSSYLFNRRDVIHVLSQFLWWYRQNLSIDWHVFFLFDILPYFSPLFITIQKLRWQFFLVKSMYFPCFLPVADFYICLYGSFKFHWNSRY